MRVTLHFSPSFPHSLLSAHGFYASPWKLPLMLNLTWFHVFINIWGGGRVKTHSMIFLWNSLSTSNSQMTINLSLISWKKKSVSFLCLAYRIAIYYKLCWKTSHTANWSMWDLIHHTEWLRIESTLLGLLLPNYAFPWCPFPWCSDLQTNTFV